MKKLECIWIFELLQNHKTPYAPRLKFYLSNSRCCRDGLLQVLCGGVGLHLHLVLGVQRGHLDRHRRLLLHDDLQGQERRQNEGLRKNGIFAIWMLIIELDYEVVWQVGLTRKFSAHGWFFQMLLLTKKYFQWLKSLGVLVPKKWILALTFLSHQKKDNFWIFWQSFFIFLKNIKGVNAKFYDVWQPWKFCSLSVIISLANKDKRNIPDLLWREIGFERKALEMKLGSVWQITRKKYLITNS